MKKKLLIVVDYQNDFVSGSLGCPQAVAIEDTLAEKIAAYRALGEEGQIIFTMDTHEKNYLETQEGQNTDGWPLYGKIRALKQEEDLVFSKPTFGSLELADYLRNRGCEYESVELAGVVTNICVISNMVITKAAMPEVPILIDAACVASNDDALDEAALKVMESMHVKVQR